MADTSGAPGDGAPLEQRLQIMDGSVTVSAASTRDTRTPRQPLPAPLGDGRISAVWPLGSGRLEKAAATWLSASADTEATVVLLFRVRQLTAKNDHPEEGMEEIDEARWKLWSLWVLASGAGWFAGMIVGAAAAAMIAEASSLMAVLFLLVTPGALMGGAQWLVLQRRTDQSALWIVGTAAAAAIGLLQTALVVMLACSLFDERGGLAPILAAVAVGFAICGALIALGQQMTANRQLQNRGPWLAAGVAGLVLVAVSACLLAVGSTTGAEPGPALSDPASANVAESVTVVLAQTAFYGMAQIAAALSAFLGGLALLGVFLGATTGLVLVRRLRRAGDA
jgi:hypothetical protein